jgi:hypothetical protein
MKLYTSLTVLISLVTSLNAFADTNIVSANHLETSFVKISQVSGDQNDAVISIQQCSGTPESASGCFSLGKRSTYTLSELRARRLKLNEEEAGTALLDAAVVAGAIAGSAATLTGGSILMSLYVAGYSAATVIPSLAGGGIGLLGGAVAVKEIKKLNPMIKDEEAASLVDVLNGKTSVKSMEDFTKQLSAALDF